jgi:uncharacterized membrane protein YphA (DoxX/SURF4 family)/thiol-disulfide isomerase/thioredoxin
VDTLVLGLRLLLAAIFATAAAGKVLDRAGTRTAMREFEVPARLQGVAAAALPAAEVTVAVALLLRPAARWGAVGAIVLLAIFMAGIAAALSRGQAPQCHCFGQLHSEPAGVSTLVRNSILVALAALVVATGPGPSIDGWLGQRSVGELVLAAAAVLGSGAAAWGATRWSRARALARAQDEARRPAGLPIGTPAPPFTLNDMEGTPVTLDSLTSRGRPVALLFAHPLCGPCDELLPKVAHWQRALAERLTIVIVTQGGAEANAALAEEFELRDVLLERRREVYEDYAIRGTPSAVVVSAARAIASDTVITEFEIEELLRLSVRRSASPSPPLANPFDTRDWAPAGPPGDAGVTPLR